IPPFTTVPATTGPKSHETDPDVLLMELPDVWAEATGVLRTSRAMPATNSRAASVTKPAKCRKWIRAPGSFLPERCIFMGFSWESDSNVLQRRSGANREQ